jgi:hypothetical protein
MQYVSFIAFVILCAVFCLSVVFYFVMCVISCVVSYCSTAATGYKPICSTNNNNNNNNNNNKATLFQPGQNTNKSRKNREIIN